MNKLFALMVLAVGLMVIACKPKATETVETPAVDTMVVAQPAQPAPMDTVTIHNLFLERHAKATGTNTTKHRKHEGKQVRYDSDPHFLHHEHQDVEAIGASGSAGGVNAGADAAAGAAASGGAASASASTGIDLEGYHYLPARWATFPGGEIALDKFLEENLKYPRPALDAGVQGTVYTSLYVDELGQVIDARFPGKKLGYGLEEEVARVLKMMPRWNPGMYNNAAVKSKFILPVKFEIKG